MAVRMLLPLSLMLALAGAQDARADSLRCGAKLVASGDAPYTVRSRCGEPDDQQRHTEVRTTQRWVSRPCTTRDNDKNLCGQSAQESVEVVIEEWLYDFGPHNFMQRVIFENGRLVAVVSVGRGSKQRASEARQAAHAPKPETTKADKAERPWWAR
jgi:hypothetical protein